MPFDAPAVVVASNQVARSGGARLALVSQDTVTGLSLPDGFRLFTRVSFLSIDPPDPFADALEHPTTDYDLSHWQQADFIWQIYDGSGFTPYDVRGVITGSSVSVFDTPEPSTLALAGFGAICGVIWGLVHKGKISALAPLRGLEIDRPGPR
jgi:hypothetical protein